MKNAIALVLGGGRGTRLYPLTKVRSKPAVPVGAKYRLIDIPLSNCLNSGIKRMYVLTQFNSVSLHRHIRRTYRFDHFDAGFVEILAAQQTLSNAGWYQGTADAVRQNLRYIEQPDVDLVLVLSGDQLYRMDFTEMVRTHRESNADVTISAVPVAASEAAALGIMRADESGRVVGFLEKPKTPPEVDLVRTDPAWIDAQGIESRGRDCLASMGIYLFNRKTLVDVLDKTDYQDFGKEVFPACMRSRRVQLHLFDGYWEDIGTIRSFYDANLALASPNAPFTLNSAEAPLYTRARFLPPTRVDSATISGSLIADGCQIESGAVIENSLIGLRCRFGRDVVIRNSIIMGNDYDEVSGEENGRPPLGIGSGSVIENAIIDKNCRIGENVRIQNRMDVDSTEETSDFIVCDGLFVATKGAVFPNGWTFEP
jgi:glucose-1-phosphate adenylyltransferase